MDSRSRLLVLYPKHLPHYEADDVFGLLDDFSTAVCCSSPATAAAFAPNVIRIVRNYRQLLPAGETFAIASSFVSDLSGLIREVRPDIVITFEAYSSLSFQSAKLRDRFGFHHVVMCNQTSGSSRSAWRVNPGTMLFFAKCRESSDSFVAFTKKAKEALLSCGVPESRVTRMLPGIPLHAYGEAHPIEVHDRIRVIYLGALRRNKGLETLQDAMRLLQASSPLPVDLTIGGSGPLADWARAWARRDSRVQFSGWVPLATKATFLSSGNIFVYPSEDVVTLGLIRWQEQTAFSVMEAMAVGLPVVGSDSGALPEIIGRPDMTFHQGSSEELAGLIRSAASDPWRLRAIGDSNRSEAQDRFSIRRYARELSDMLHRLAEGPTFPG